MRRLAAAAAATALIAAGCGGESGDLLAVEVTGGPQAEERAVVITEDGRARCDGGELRPIASDKLIEAREIERELGELPEAERRLAAAGGRSYVARMREGAVHWSERSRGKPELLARVELLALQLRRSVCAG